MGERDDVIEIRAPTQAVLAKMVFSQLWAIYLKGHKGASVSVQEVTHILPRK